MKQKSLSKVVKPVPLTGAKLHKFLGLLDRMMALAVVADCERLDGEMSLTVSPDGTGTMTVSYDMGTRYCCTCQEDDSTCGECIKSNRAPGVIREGPQFRGSVQSWSFRAPRAIIQTPIVVVKKRKQAKLLK